MLAMYYESQGELVKAQEILLELISEDPTDSQTLKRLVSLYRDMDMET